MAAQTSAEFAAATMTAGWSNVTATNHGEGRVRRHRRTSRRGRRGHDRCRAGADGSPRSTSEASRCSWAGRAAAIGWGSYPMAPWVGRVRHGRFSFEGVDHQLDAQPHRRRRHARTRSTAPCSTPRGRSTAPIDTTAVLHCDLGRHGWPFGGIARQTIAADRSGGALRVVGRVRAAQPFPAAIGWHPWFLKPDRLDFRPTAMYQRDGIGLPTAELVEPVPGPWDDTFLNTEPGHAALFGPRRRVDGHGHVRLRPLGGVRPAGVRDLRRAAVGPTRRAHDAAATSSPPELRRCADGWRSPGPDAVGSADLPAGNRAPIASPECHRPDSILTPRSRSRTSPTAASPTSAGRACTRDTSRRRCATSATPSRCSAASRTRSSTSG